MNSIRHRTYIAFARVLLTVVVVSLALAMIYLATHAWFGKGDLPAFATWSAAFAVYVFVAGRVLVRILPQGPRRSRLAVAALVGLALGFVWTFALALLLPWFGAFSFPVLYFWMASGLAGLLVQAHANGALIEPTPPVGAGRQFFRPAVLVFGLPIVAVIAVIALGLLYTAGSALVWDRGEPEIHLLPDGYVGPVTILYNLPDGDPPAHEGDRRVYRIGGDGIARTQFARNRGTSWREEFFYTRADGERVQITERWHSTIADTPENRADSLTVGIYFGHAGVFAPTSEDPDCHVATSGYTVGTKADILAHRGSDALLDHLAARPLPCQRKSSLNK